MVESAEERAERGVRAEDRHSYFDRVRIDAVRVERGRLPEERVDRVGARDADERPHAPRVEVLNLRLELLRLVQHQIHLGHVARQMALGVVVAQLLCIAPEREKEGDVRTVCVTGCFEARLEPWRQRAARKARSWPGPGLYRRPCCRSRLSCR